MVSFSKICIAGLIGAVFAHPGEKHDAKVIEQGIVARDYAAKLGARALSKCSGSSHSQAMRARSVQRRTAQYQTLRQKRGITTTTRKNKRTLEDLGDWEAVNHNLTDFVENDMFTSLDEIFGANTSCILAPEVTNGPYYVAGEYFRSNVIEEEWCEGVNVFIELQYIDINTCEPVPALAVDIWNTNATGIYAGITGTDLGGLNSTYLRGIQYTDHDGVVSFETIFPGHYDGRAVHTHILAHSNATIAANGTIPIFEKSVTHIGQIFWPEELRAEVEATYPYTLNDNALTVNDDDQWAIIQADASYDPFPKFVYLGESIEAGLFAWIQIGVNASADYSDSDYYGVAAYLDHEGGHSTGWTVGGGSNGGDSGEESSGPNSTNVSMN